MQAFILSLIPALGLALAAGVGHGATPLLEFTESGGCKLKGSVSSVTRQKEIAAQGTVTWEGACVGGYIDGPGVLRHEGTTSEAGRTRRFAFLLSGTAQAGLRSGTWTRESFNMFTDSPAYWTSVATINYVDGAAKGPTRVPKARGPDDFSPAFRQLLAALDRDIAAARLSAQPPAAPAELPPLRPAPAAPVASPASPAAGAPARAQEPGLTPAPVAARAEASSAPLRTQPVTTASTARLVFSPPAEAAARAAATPEPANPGTAPAPFTGATAAVARNLIAPELRDALLRPLAGPGRPLPPPAPPPLPQQQLLEQRGACNVEQINGEVVREETIVAPAAAALRVAGWATDPQKPHAAEAPRVPQEAWIRFYDRAGGPGLLVEMPRNTERPDVARALGHPAHAQAGFRITVEAGQLRPGEYTVAILQRIGADLAVCSSIGRLSLR